MEEAMKVWKKPSVREQQIGLEVTSYLLAVGGLLNGRRVAETMSKKIVPLAREQGLVANLVTSVLVLSASSFGLPVSTTHISVGAISGTGFVTGKLDRTELGGIVLSWVMTLPLAASLAAGTALLLD
jgi:PiT family inorganic phosphate transporter